MSVLIEHEAEHLAEWLSTKDAGELAEKIDVALSVAYKIKRGTYYSSRDIMRRLMKVYGVDTKTLLGEPVPYIEYPLDDVGKRIRQAREDVYMTCDKLAEELNVSFKSLLSWERGRHTPNRYMLEDIAFLTGLSDEEFFTMTLLDLSQLGPYLKQIRKERDMSKAEMGLVADVASVTIMQWERGAHAPNIRSIKYIADLVGLSLSEFAEKAKQKEAEGFSEENYIRNKGPWDSKDMLLNYQP